jgi:hypothetical protein
MSPDTDAFIAGKRRMIDPNSVLQRHLGPEGRLISRTRSGYRSEFPDHLVIWNAQVWVGSETVYRGDLDLSVDEPLLKAAALEVGELYVLTEHEELFNPSDPKLRKRFVYWTNGTNRRVGDGYWERFGWDTGALRQRPSWPGDD